MAQHTDVSEQYAASSKIEQMSGFTRDQFKVFIVKKKILKDERGWPVWQIIRALTEDRYAKPTDMTAAARLTEEKIRKEQINNAIKMKEYILRSLAVDRIRTTLQAVANKIRYAIKTSSPRICGLMNVADIENILSETYNNAIEQLEQQADAIQTWEEYGFSFQQTGNQVAPNTQETPSGGSSEEDTVVNEDEHLGEDRVGPDSLPKGTSLFNW